MSHTAQEVLERATLLDHDIRNAAADILGGFENADLQALDETSRHHLDQALQACRQMLQLSQAALTLATGDTRFIEGPETAMCLRNFMRTLSARYNGLPVTVDHCDPSSGLPQTLHVPLHTMERILTNLIGNAIKYGNGKPVSVTVDLDLQNALIFAVSDQGPGFSDEAKSRLFEFSGRDSENGLPGSGHGLHIANSLARDLQGRLTMETSSTSGTTVSLHLPKQVWSAGKSESSKEMMDLSGQSVLIVEDSRTLQMVLQRMVESMGARATVASDGIFALERLAAQNFDLALVDIEMPRMSGLDLIRNMRRQGSPTSDLPVLAVTAYVLNADRQEIYDVGADGILVKPVLSAIALSEGIETALVTRRSAKEDPLPEVDGPDPTHIDRLLAFCDTQQAQDLIMRLIADLENVALVLERAPKVKDFNELRSAAHILVALSGAVGAVGLQKIAERLNAAAKAKHCEEGNELCTTALDGTLALIEALQRDYEYRFGDHA
ncbi:hypothetical protein GCM10011517_03780 [Actibacterium pelagium]|uniref:histidine kinase n=2 Tax=Actibacterium pelagium TaxID=2029103 RepID=A0A917AB17_9RHOB|nr:hypothetical protein GCM10011517_03780 [Actibacterium pelagium]